MDSSSPGHTDSCSHYSFHPRKSGSLGEDGQGDPESLTEGRGSEDSLGLTGVDIGVMAGMSLQRSPRGLSLLILQDPDKIGSRSVSELGHLKKIFE